MPMSYTTWSKAEKRYKEKGMGEQEILKHKAAWFKKHKEDKSTVGQIKKRKKNLEEALEGVTF